MKTRIESPPWVDDRGHPQGCDDATLYRKFAQLGLPTCGCYPFISSAFSDPTRLQFLEGGILPTLDAEEAGGVAGGGGAGAGRRDVFYLNAVPLRGGEEGLKGNVVRRLPR